MGRFIRTGGLVVSAALAAGPAVAESHAKATSLAWSRAIGAETCVDETELGKAVERRLGHSALVPPARADLVLAGRVEPVANPPSWRAVITLADAAGASLGERELTNASASCRGFDDDLTLVLALMIDPDAKLAPAPAQTPTPGFTVQIEARGAAAEGLVPGVAPGFAAGAILRSAGGWGVDGYATLWRSASVHDASAKGSSFQLLLTGLGVCPPTLALGRARLGACGGVELGSLVATGLGLERKFTSHKTVVHVGARGDITYPIVGPVIAALGVGLSVPFQDDEYFYVDGAGVRHDVFQVHPVALIEDLGLGVVFP